MYEQFPFYYQHFNIPFRHFQATSKNKYLQFWTCKIHLILICLQNLSKPDYIILNRRPYAIHRAYGSKKFEGYMHVCIVITHGLCTIIEQYMTSQRSSKCHVGADAVMAAKYSFMNYVFIIFFTRLKTYFC